MLIWLIYKLFRTLHMSRRPNTKTNKPLTIHYFPIYLLTYLLKSNPGNPVPATGYPVPNPVPTSNHYCLYGSIFTRQCIIHTAITATLLDTAQVRVLSTNYSQHTAAAPTAVRWPLSATGAVAVFIETVIKWLRVRDSMRWTFHTSL